MIPIWDKRQELINHPRRVEEVVSAGTEKAQKKARESLEEIKEAMKI
jgi:hypothetical protein